MRKTLALTLCLALLIGLVAGCAAPTTPAATTPASTTAKATTAIATTAAATTVPKPVNMRIMWWGSQARHDATIAVIGLYEKKYTNVKFAYEFMGSNDYFPKLTTLVAAKDVPDVFQMGNNFLTYESAIEPLDTYIQSKAIDMSDTSEPYIAPTRINGKILGVCLGTNTWALLYDPAMFKSAGVALPTENWTWDEFEKAAITISQKLNIYGTGAINDFWGLANYVSQYGKDVGIYDATSKGLGFSDDKMSEAFFSMLKRLMDVKGVYPTTDVIAAIKDVQGDPFVTGKAAMMWVASNQIVAVATAAKKPVGITPFPKLTATGISGMAIRASQSMSLSKTSANKDQGASFISFFVNDIEANRLLKGERGVPIMAKVRTDLASQSDDVTKAMYGFIDLVGKIASHPQPLEPVGQIEISDMTKRVLEELALGKVTPAQAAASFRKQATDILKK